MTQETYSKFNFEAGSHVTVKPQHEIAKFSVSNGQVNFIWADGRTMNIVFSWLRDWCQCDACTDRRTVDSAAMMELSLNCSPRHIELSGNGDLHIVWEPDDHKSVYPVDWLRKHCTPHSIPIAGHSGDELDRDMPVVEYDAFRDEELGQLDLLEMVRDYGFAVLRGVSCTPEEVGEIGSRLGYIPNGWRFTAQPEELLVATENGSKDSAAKAMKEAKDAHFLETLLVPHTDFSFTSWPTGLFVFHCLSPSSDGGGATILVDGFHVAERLRMEDLEAFEQLSTIRYPFQGHGPIKSDWCAEGRVISTNEEGAITGIRFALPSRQPLPIKNDQIDSYNRATQAMLRLLLDPKCQVQISLKAGDCLVLDNHRILHGRTGMDPRAGKTRWFRRFDVERDAAQTRMRVLARKFDRDVAPLPAGAHG